MTSRRRYRAPKNDGEALIDPPLSEAAKLVAENRASAVARDKQSGLPFLEWMTKARKPVITISRARDRSDSLPLETKPMIASGHQPELYHPGVWFKSFLLDAVAQSVDGIGLNLIVDNDLSRGTSIRVPTGQSVVEVPLDVSKQPIPWEQREIEDLRWFDCFDRRIHDVKGTGTAALVVDRLWPYATAYVDYRLRVPVTGERVETGSLRAALKMGQVLAAARHGYERELGLNTCEDAISGACFDRVYLAFAKHLLDHARELHRRYNEVLAEYRLVNGIRNSAHPVPDLEVRGDSIEMPFWFWSDLAPQRERVFWRSRGKSWEITGGAHGEVRRELGWWHGTAEQFEDLETKSAIKLRPRALITTMYARLVLSDLFIHGIGGAKYDEVTDEIIRRFFGIEPPKYITATATFRLPIERPHVTIEDVREAKQKLRDVRYRPENFLRDPLTKQVPGLRESLQALADEKREYVRTHDLRRCAEQVFARLDTINRAMHELLKPIEQVLRAQDAQLQEDLRRADLLGSREFSFVLFPADELPARLLALSKVSA